MKIAEVFGNLLFGWRVPDGPVPVSTRKGPPEG